MGTTLSDGAKIGVVMMICCAIIAVIVFIATATFEWNRNSTGKIDAGKFTDHAADFEAMAIYGEALPMANVVAVLDLYGEPDRLCVQMEDLENEYGGTPYPVADIGTQKMATLITLLRNYYDKEVYVYTYSNVVGGSKADLQLCISEFKHGDGSSASTQNWEKH